VFPLNRDFRMGLSKLYSEVRWKGSRASAIDALQREIAENPNAADLHRNLAGFLFENGNEEEAQREVHIVHRLAPNSNIVLFVNTNPATN
jgi:Flp pilus assembly protein TadD